MNDCSKKLESTYKEECSKEYSEFVDSLNLTIPQEEQLNKIIDSQIKLAFINIMQKNV